MLGTSASLLLVYSGLCWAAGPGLANQQSPLRAAPIARSSFIDESIFRRQPQQPHAHLLSEQPQDGSLVHAYDDFSADTPYQGIAYFAHLNSSDCFSPKSQDAFDIAIVGAPFDLGVTYRPGARFGPAGARMGSRRLSPSFAYSMDHATNPFLDWATVVDCGDIANSPFDKLEAIHDLQKGWEAIASRNVRNKENGTVPRIIAIGGDHTISLPALRALNKQWGKVSVLHLDSHLDLWDPKQLGGGLTRYSEVTHGSMFHILHEEGVIADTGNMHLGSRSKLMAKHYDMDHDAACGFSAVRARDLDKFGVEHIVKRVVETVGNNFVYLSIDIDVMDPAFTPATGTIEPGGWTSREVFQVLGGLKDAGVKIVGADVVEFTPIYDNRAETTAILVTELVYEILQWMIQVPVPAA